MGQDQYQPGWAPNDPWQQQQQGQWQQQPQWPGQYPQQPYPPQPYPQQPWPQEQPPQWPQQPDWQQPPAWPQQPDWQQQQWGAPPEQPMGGVPQGIKQVNVYVQSEAETTMAHVDRYPFRMGRDSSAVELRLMDRKASRVHAQIFLYEGTIYVEDLGSSNGTWMNGQRITGPTELHSGDEFQVGASRITVEIYEE